MDQSLAAILTLNTIAHTVGAIGSGAKATAVFGSAWFGLFSAIMTLMILFLSEIIPKTLGAVHWRKLAGVTAHFVRALVVILYPLIWLSEKLTKLIAGSKRAHEFSREEFLAMAGFGAQSGQINEGESRIIGNLFRLDSLKAEVRKERLMEYTTAHPNDASEIERLFIKTFSDSEGQTEGEMIGHLARDLMIGTPKDDLYCFAAREDEQIVGSIFFSRITFEREVKAFILAPVAVRTDHQGKGIGQKLIAFGLNTLSKDGVELAITYGDPSFYSKVGFQSITEAIVPAPLTLQHPEGWLAQSMKGDEIEPIKGKSSCVKALNKPEYW